MCNMAIQLCTNVALTLIGIQGFTLEVGNLCNPVSYMVKQRLHDCFF